MNTKNYHHIPQNLLLFIFLVGLFVLPIYSFTIFTPATQSSTNVLGESTKTINGLGVTVFEKGYKIEGLVPSKRVVKIPLASNIQDKEVYLKSNTKNIIVTLSENTVEIYNTSNIDQKVSILLY